MKSTTLRHCQKKSIVNSAVNFEKEQGSLCLFRALPAGDAVHCVLQLVQGLSFINEAGYVLFVCFLFCFSRILHSLVWVQLVITSLKLQRCWVDHFNISRATNNKIASLQCVKLKLLMRYSLNFGKQYDAIGTFLMLHHSVIVSVLVLCCQIISVF